MDKSSGELVTLTPNNNNTVQPVALMRLGVFVPTLKSLKNSKKNTLSRTDATEELTRLSLARAEGFDKVEITGPRLDMDNDFKTWVGIIHSFARHNVIGDKVELPFVEFAKLCGIPSSQSSRRLRERISPSLKRIAGTVISFSRTDEKHTREYITHLVQSAYYDTEGTVAKLAMRQPFVLFKGLTFQKLCLPGAFRPGDHHNKMLRPGLCVVHASPQYL